MRVVINGLAALKPRTGVGHHVAHLAAALAAVAPDDSFTLYPGDRVGRVVGRVQRPAVGAPGSPTRRRRGGAVRSALGFAKAAAKAASGLHFAAYTRAFHFDLYHEPNFLPFRSHLPTVVTVHDLSVVRFPDWHPADRVRSHGRHFFRALDRAAHVIVVTEAVRRELTDEFGVSPGRVTAVYNGISPTFRPLGSEAVEPVRRRLGLPPRYFLCVGTIEPRKNVGTAMRAFADLPPVVREACPLVLVGPWGWKSDADREFFTTVGRDRGVRHLGYVADADLPAAYAGAVGLVYPSYYEGFGLPPVEMLACGGAVLASTAAAVREVCGGRAEFVEPDDVPGWRAAMLRLATDDEYRGQMSCGGVAHAARFTWEAAARRTREVYKQVRGTPARSNPPAASRPAAEQVNERHRVEKPV